MVLNVVVPSLYAIFGVAGTAYTFTTIDELEPLISLKVIVAEPTPSAVISPVEAFTPTTELFEVVQAEEVAGVPVAESTIDSPSHNSKLLTWLFGPEISGAALTVKVAVA